MGEDRHDLLCAVLRFDLRLGWRDPFISSTNRKMSASGAEHKVVYSGGCHCGAVRFEIRAPSTISVLDCNCTICTKSGFLHLIVDAGDFTLTSGEDVLTTYTFNTQSARHLFCVRCGIKSFYIPRSHPHGYSVNARCLDPGSYSRMDIEPFDGANWESSIGALR